MGEITSFPSGLSSFGGVLTPGFPITGQSQVIWCDNVAGNDGFDGSAPDSAVKTVARGYSLLRSGFYDTLILVGRGTAYTLTVPLVWAKDYTNLFGFTAPINVAHRARITSGTATISPMITFSGTGISVQNVQLAQFGSDATLSAIAVLVSGQRCFFKNVHFSGGNNATVRAGTAMRSLVVSGVGGNGENVFDHCFIGNDVQGTAGVNYELAFDTFTPRNAFRDCTFYKITLAGGAGGGFISFPAGSLDRWTLFERCNFINDVGVAGFTTLTTAFLVTAADGVILMRDPIVTGATGMTGGSKVNFLISSIIAAATGGLATETSS